MTSASASASSGSKHRIPDQDATHLLITQGEAKKFKINPAGASLRVGSTENAAAASTSTTLTTVSVAQATFESSATASSSSSTLLTLSTLDGQVEYLGPDRFAVILSYLNLNEINDLSKQIFSEYSIPDSSHKKNTLDQLLKLIQGSYYFLENKPITFLLSSADTLPTNAIIRYSPVLFSQLDGLTSLSLDYIYYLCADLELFTFDQLKSSTPDQQETVLEKIFKVVGPRLLELDFDKIYNLLESDSFISNPFIYPRKINLTKLMEDIITLAGEHCPNLKTLRLPTKSFPDLHDGDDIELVAKEISESLKKWKKLSNLEFNIDYKIKGGFPDSVVHASIYGYIPDTRVDYFELELPLDQYRNLHSFRMINCIDDNFLVELAAKCPNLTSVIADLNFHEAIKVDKGVIALIEKCRSLTCMHLSKIIISFEVMMTFLRSNLQLRRVCLEIGWGMDRGGSLDPNLLRAFFNKFPTLESFDGGTDVSDHHFEVLLEFVTKNIYLKNFCVTFGSDDGIPAISVDQLTDFIDKSSHINSVHIDVRNFVNFPHDHFTQWLREFPNVTLNMPKTV